MAVADQLALAATRVRRTKDPGQEAPQTMRPARPEQVVTLDAFDRYLCTVASRNGPGSYARIVLPPRTGKTVVAGHIIARCGLSALFVVPTRVLVQQTEQALKSQLPDVPIGVLYGESQRPVGRGVNITTYAMLDRMGSQASQSPAIGQAPIVFLDEAHHSMTRERLQLIRSALAEDAMRIALTATPDYDERRALCRFFPDLIHEMTVEEALELGLLAPARIWVAEVDNKGSEVRLIAGDFDEGELGRVMSEAPFLRAAELFRYQAKNRDIPALIACASCAQASELVSYLESRRPPGSRAIGLVLGTTPREERESVLSAFENGEIDTIVQVGVLIEGWNSPRCKLLIDLYPSMSKVRATQKYFRVLTPFAGQEARLYLILPSELPAMPVLPTELFGPSFSDYACGTLINEKDRSGSEGDSVPCGSLPIESVRLRKRILLEARFSPPTLDRSDIRRLREVLLSSEGFDPDYPPTLREFRQMLVRHQQFTGRGEALLRWLGLPTTIAGYATMLARAFPRHAGASRLWLGQVWEGECRYGIKATVRRMRLGLVEGGRPGSAESFAVGWRAATGGADGYTLADASTAVPTPEETLLRREQLAQANRGLNRVTIRSRRILAMTYGLAGMPALPVALVALIEDVEPKTMAAIIKRVTAEFVGRFNPRLLIHGAWGSRGPASHPPDGSDQPKLFRPPRPYNSPARNSRTIYATRSWTVLRQPFPFSGLLSRVTRCLENIQASTGQLKPLPYGSRHAAEGANCRHLEWVGPGCRLHVYAIDGRCPSPGIGERSVPVVFAQLVLELPDRHRRPELCLLGVEGVFQGISIEGDSDGRLARAWAVL